MARLGKVLHITKRGSLILRVKKIPPMGPNAVVLNTSAKRVGIVQDVFGPVKNPYVSIKPDDKERATRLVGQVLYLKREKR